MPRRIAFALAAVCLCASATVTWAQEPLTRAEHVDRIQDNTRLMSAARRDFEKSPEDLEKLECLILLESRQATLADAARKLGLQNLMSGRVVERAESRWEDFKANPRVVPAYLRAKLVRLESLDVSSKGPVLAKIAALTEFADQLSRLETESEVIRTAVKDSADKLDRLLAETRAQLNPPS